MANFLLYLFTASWPMLSNIVLFDAGAGIPAVDFLRTVTVLFLLLLFFRSTLLGWSFRFGPIVLPCIISIVFFLLCLVSRNFVGGYKLAVAGIVDLYVVPISIYLYIINCSKINYKIFARCMLLSGIYVAAVGVAEYIVGRNLIGPLSMIEMADNWKQVYAVYRANGPFYDIIGYGGVLLLYIPFTFYVWKKKFIGTKVYFASTLIISAGSVVTLSKANVISLVVVLFILMFDFETKRLLFVFYFSILFAIFCYSFFEVFSRSTIYKDRIVSTSTVTGRWQQYMFVLKLFFQHPFWGIGYGQYHKLYHIHVHNSYLGKLVELGVMGFVPYIYFIYSIIFSKLKYMLNEFRSDGSRVRWAIVFIVIFVASTIDLLFNRHFMLLLMMIVGFLCIYENYVVSDVVKGNCEA